MRQHSNNVRFPFTTVVVIPRSVSRNPNCCALIPPVYFPRDYVGKVGDLLPARDCFFGLSVTTNLDSRKLPATHQEQVHQEQVH